ncbi:hypothetical protein AB0I84_36850 [Streptomyces spectabilis]|uniref:hypothetical protein n=1 Tax=Streptomyces spectabilis TaxID=68270 RepID=UPI0033F4F9A2
MEPYGQLFVDTTINTSSPGQQGSGRAIIKHKFTNPAWGSSNSYELSTSDVRCDTALPGTTRQVGCINPGYLPEMVYAKSGPYPELAKHIEYAQNVKNLPGKHGTIRYLTWLTNKTKHDENRDNTTEITMPRMMPTTACRCGGRGGSPPRPGASPGKRPPGRSSVRGRWSGAFRRAGDPSGPHLVSHFSHVREGTGGRESLWPGHLILP